MSEVKVNKISPRTNCGTVTLGDSGDTFTIPAGATITNSGTAAGFGSTGEVSWDTTKKTTGFTATSGVGYFCDTTSAAFTVTLPATPSAGNVVAVSDYNGNFLTNNLTIGRNGSNIQGEASDFVFDKNNVTAQFIYIDSTEGWRIVFTGAESDLRTNYVTATGGTITTCGDFKIHTFTGPGTFQVTRIADNTDDNNLDYLVVAGGGGSTTGGGGAGGFRYSSSTYCSPSCAPGHPLRSTTGLSAAVQSYPVTVGGGGTAGTYTPATSGGAGVNSVFSTITSAGGGGGGKPGSPSGAGNGGSGGGTGGDPGPTAAGAGNTPPVSPPQGNPGGTGSSTGSWVAGSGGGGAIGSGTAGQQNNCNANGGPGGAGAGLPTAFGSNGESCGSFRYYSGGGGGGSSTDSTPTPTVPSGGVGGGGNGANVASTAGNAGTANTGGGAGGGEFQADGAAGGSGIVVIRYKFQ